VLWRLQKEGRAGRDDRGQRNGVDVCVQGTWSTIGSDKARGFQAKSLIQTASISNEIKSFSSQQRNGWGSLQEVIESPRKDKDM
jgi:hypothetical protein